MIQLTDKLSAEKRSWNMSRIKNKGTKIEEKVCKYLYNSGFRYRKNVNNLPGKPDIVLSKYKTVVFVHGCFWHGHEGCKLATIPKSNTEFWVEKIRGNIERDKKNTAALKNLGWNVIAIYECEINNDFLGTMNYVINEIKNGN